MNTFHVAHLIGDSRLELVVGNIVEQHVDAIVNAANTRLSGGGGVDGAIHRAAGRALREACAALPENERGRRCLTGQVRTTLAGLLSAKVVIHAVGPFYNVFYIDKVETQLCEVYRNSLSAAVQHHCRSVAFPSISTGAYRFPLERAAELALKTVVEFLTADPPLEVVRFVLHSPGQFEVFRSVLSRVTSA